MNNEFTRGPWYRSGCTVYAPNDRNNANRFTAYVQDAHSSREDLLSVARMMQAAPDLFKALQAARLFISNGIELGYITMPDADTPDPAHATLPMIDAAIAKATGGDA